MKRYEQSIRVVTAFFAVLLGFGLKKLLDVNPDTKSLDEIHTHPAPYFVLSASLFLRFLLGSANHLWHDYVLPDSKETVEFKPLTFELMRDLFFLVILGFLGIAICYSTTVDDFFTFHFYFTFIAFVWVLVAMAGEDKQIYTWLPWLFINLIQGAVILGAWLWARHQKWGPVPLSQELLGKEWEIYLLALVAVYIVILIADVSFQLWTLTKAQMPQPAPVQADAQQDPRGLPQEIGDLAKAIVSLTSHLKGLSEKQEKLEAKPALADKAQVTE